MADKLMDLFPDPPVVKLDKPRQLILKFKTWRKMEPMFGSFLGTWAAVLRVTNATAAAMFIRTIAPDQAQAVIEAAKVLHGQGPILDDVVVILWALCLVEAERNGETLTIQQVEDAMRMEDLHEYLQAIKTAVENASPPANPPEPGPQAGAHGTGEKSTVGAGATSKE